MAKSITRAVASLIALPLVFVSPAGARSLTDATGHTVEIPDTVARVLPAGQPAAVLVYVLAPEKMLAWPRRPRGPGQALLLPQARELPEIGPLVLSDGQVNDVVLKEMKPDLVVDYGSLTPGYVEAAKRLQAELGIPYLILDGTLERSAEALRALGPAVGATERAELLATEAERILKLTRERARQREGSSVRTYYYARSEDGLSTATSAARATDVLRLLALEDVADGSDNDLPKVTREQLLAWNPDAVFAPNPDFIKAFARPEWAELPAVKAKRVFAAPRPPFGWIDEPPSVNRLLGLLWVGHVLFPQAYPEDLRQEAKAFHRLFYQVEPSDAQLDRLLQQP
jgi:iron complex transport system substrate-binding protein